MKQSQEHPLFSQNLPWMHPLQGEFLPVLTEDIAPVSRVSQPQLPIFFCYLLAPHVHPICNNRRGLYLVGYYVITQLCMDYFINHEPMIPSLNNQDSIKVGP